MENFLQNINLSKYNRLFSGQGYENLGDIFNLDSEDLNMVYIDNGTERNAILNAVANIDIGTWLRYYELEKYETYFRKLKIEILGDLKRVKMSDELMDDLEVMVPGHRKRLLKAVSGFSKDDGQYQNCGRAVAFGYWGRHDVIKTLKRTFWVKKCFIKSNIPGHDPVELANCLVDTGSEVVTIQQDIMSELNLTFLQTVSSRGIHKAKEKPLYSAVMLLGNNVIEVKVIPDSYNSIGCNVFQKFSHFVNEKDHYWLTKES
ncbi:uncharacterized protein LOC124436395 [Xenia sp. Carnegie-2017]|uniref:uncharacterized protein LOC124436395 n=1 Tax=Xenia sp. Carnegie-2017 TaxID=2897299 RepID=UPI001F041CA8|nr:uncharacterized protein LOC124436395 [Xenia sp. Carnegie-2017]